MQVVNVATLPGIVRASYAMPDVHWGYGFPIGGVAATDVDNDGVVSPGGVGFDISCGVRLLVGEGLDREELQPRLPAVMDRLDRAIPRGVGTAGVWRLPDRNTLQEVLTGGARFAVEQGHGVALDLERCEDGGVMTGADAAKISDRASNAAWPDSAALARATTSWKSRPWTASTIRLRPRRWVWRKGPSA